MTICHIAPTQGVLMSATTVHSGSLLGESTVQLLDALLARAQSYADPLIRGDQPKLVCTNKAALLQAYTDAKRVAIALAPLLEGVEGDELALHVYLERLSKAYHYAWTCLDGAVRLEEDGVQMDVLWDAMKHYANLRKELGLRLSSGPIN